MVLGIVALIVYVFGAYAYGYLAWLWFAWRRPGAPRPPAATPLGRHAARVSLAMFVFCTAWFVLNAFVVYRALMGLPAHRSLADLAVLVLVLLFPALILHLYLVEARVGVQASSLGRWRAALAFQYAAGAGAASYFIAAIFRFAPAPSPIGPFIGLAIAALFTITSLSCLLLMRGGPPARAASGDRRRLHRALRILFVSVMVVTIALTVGRDDALIIRVLEAAVRATPLYFLAVSVYFEHRVQFYDLVIKRGALLVLGLLVTAGMLTLTQPWADRLDGPARPWLFAVLLLPAVLLMPWLHHQVGRLLDRWWFGRPFAPADAVTHVLGAMQQATDDQSLTAAAERTLAEMFGRRIVVQPADAPLPAGCTELAQVDTPGAGTRVRLAVADDPGGRALLSEDVALLRSLGAVFASLLENVRLHRRRQDQEALAQTLRLQTSRAELKALRAQINPHFLFNALNAIASLIHTDPARADAAVEQLAEVFRYTLRRSDQDWAALDQELAFARAYLDVEQARFGKRLSYTIEADARVQRAYVPSMLLQTLVENAVKHGIARLRAPGRIDVRAALDDGRVVLEVRDTGPGPDAGPAAPAGEGFGLRSVRDRLRAHFGAAGSLHLGREGDATVARLEVPLIETLAPAAGGPA